MGFMPAISVIAFLVGLPASLLLMHGATQFAQGCFLVSLTTGILAFGERPKSRITRVALLVALAGSILSLMCL